MYSSFVTDTHPCSSQHGDNVGHLLPCEERERVLLTQQKVLQDTEATGFSFGRWCFWISWATFTCSIKCWLWLFLRWSPTTAVANEVPETHGLGVLRTAITRSEIGHREHPAILSRERSSWTESLTQNPSVTVVHSKVFFQILPYSVLIPCR